MEAGLVSQGWGAGGRLKSEFHLPGAWCRQMDTGSKTSFREPPKGSGKRMPSETPARVHLVSLSSGQQRVDMMDAGRERFYVLGERGQVSR